MEDKIEVGDYVRSNLGSIGKVTKIEEGKFLYENKSSICFISNVVNHSKNIIKLIEAGDYVNGYEVITVYGYDENGNDKDGLGICEVDDDYAYYTYLEDIDIKSLVTKEQFKSMEYKVGE